MTTLDEYNLSKFAFIYKENFKKYDPQTYYDNLNSTYLFYAVVCFLIAISSNMSYSLLKIKNVFTFSSLIILLLLSVFFAILSAISAFKQNKKKITTKKIDAEKIDIYKFNESMLYDTLNCMDLEELQSLQEYLKKLNSKPSNNLPIFISITSLLISVVLASINQLINSTTPKIELKTNESLGIFFGIICITIIIFIIIYILLLEPNIINLELKLNEKYENTINEILKFNEQIREKPLQRYSKKIVITKSSNM
ncbi:hypothetical protein [Floricoccus tropicus]|nr:hypothetical protein [Floricoccus tropicus]